jgi:hypothetical protein
MLIPIQAKYDQMITLLYSLGDYLVLTEKKC